MDKYKENSGSMASKHRFESAANIQERKRKDTALETLTERIERAEDKHDDLREVVMEISATAKEYKNKMLLNKQRSVTCWRK